MYISDSDECFEGYKAESYDVEGAGAALEEAVREDLNGRRNHLFRISEKAFQAGELTELPAKHKEPGCSRKRLHKSQIALSKQNNQETT